MRQRKWSNSLPSHKILFVKLVTKNNYLYDRPKTKFPDFPANIHQEEYLCPSLCLSYYGHCNAALPTFSKKGKYLVSSLIKDIPQNNWLALDACVFWAVPPTVSQCSNPWNMTHENTELLVLQFSIHQHNSFRKLLKTVQMGETVVVLLGRAWASWWGKQMTQSHNHIMGVFFFFFRWWMQCLMQKPVLP